MVKLAHHWLEGISGEKLSSIIFPSELEEEDHPNWYKYDPREEVSVELYLDQLVRDDLDNLSGPWEFYGPHGVRSKCPPRTKFSILFISSRHLFVECPFASWYWQ